MTEDGLAQQAQQRGPTVEEIVQMLMQGVDPRELLKKGVPQELLMQAMQIMKEQMQPQSGDGLAAMATQNPAVSGM